jgi:hypothetical protein
MTDWNKSVVVLTERAAALNEPQGKERREWQEWFRRHGVEPPEEMIMLVERRPHQRQIRFCTGPLSNLIVQLEAAPLPFPALSKRWQPRVKY